MSDTENQYLKLQNGSDIRGVAVEGVEGESVNLTRERMYYIARSFVKSVCKKTGKEAGDIVVTIGHDSRISAKELKDAAVFGILKEGAKPVYTGLSTTPAMFMSTVLPGIKSDGAMMLTASHLPYNRNGAKLFTANGGYEKTDIAELLKDAAAFEERDGEAGSVSFWEKGEGSPCGEYDLMKEYSAHLCDIIKKNVNAGDYDAPLKGLHIVVDAGNGASGFFAPDVLKKLGADVSGSRFLEPDGMFPNHQPNPENKKAMESIQSCVLENKADLGIIFDTDGDRAAAVFADGSEINRNAFIAISAAILAKDYPGTTVVTDSITSDELTDFLENSLGMKHHRFKRGYRNVINEAVRLNNEGIETHLAMETSGHGAVKENYFLDDGAYLSVMLICALASMRNEGGDVTDLIKDLKYPAEATEFRMKIPAEDFAAFGEKTIGDFRSFCKETEGFSIEEKNYEGVRVRVDTGDIHGWLLLRMSLHDPILPLNVESKEPGGLEKILDMVRGFFKERGLEL